MNTLFLNTAILSFIASIFGGIIPIKRKNIQHGHWMHYMDLFCDAMFIAIALGHFLPEIYHHNSTGNFALFSLLIMVTAYAIYKANNIENSHFKYFFIYVFFLHCFVEGLALPIISDHHLQTTLSIAVVAHKIIEPFVFFSVISRQNWSQKQLISLLIFFASLTPFGIFSGMFLTSMPGSFLWGINAVTCGTFLGISTNCYFNNSCHDHHQQKWIMLAFIILSFFLVSLLGHGHAHCH